MMTIREITENKKEHLALLLLADEQENMIDRYLNRGKHISSHRLDLQLQLRVHEAVAAAIALILINHRIWTFKIMQRFSINCFPSSPAVRTLADNKHSCAGRTAK